MSVENTIRALLARLETADPADWRRKSARIGWVKDTMTALRAAQKRVDEAWDRMLDALPDPDDEDAIEALPDPPEQAELDALHAQLRAVINHDRWPSHLYFGSV